jgi:para-nitrobenzyl esterase
MRTRGQVFAALFSVLLVVPFANGADQGAVKVRTKYGVVEGAVNADGKVRMFKGIPFAAPPVGPLRWKPPQPPAAWSGVRKATAFGARCMQGRIYSDMVFRDDGPSEDCLYLNVWTPARAKSLPVMVWIYGGGFNAGAASEPRQDGEKLAEKGVVVVSMNYRLGVFGFYSHPELTKESPHHASGNYGLMDQWAALQWVRDNIARFGGDPKNVTIFGESAGSFSVCAQMASPLARGLVQKAIGESGAFTGSRLGARPVSDTEQTGLKFAEAAFGTTSLEKLRALPADQILEASLKNRQLRFWPNIDGYFFTEDPTETYAAGRQAHVPLLAGWNADEGSYQSFFGQDEATRENYIKHAREQFGANADEFLKLYPAETDAEAKRSAQDYAGDQFIAFATWKWIELQHETAKAPVYRYRFDNTLPLPADAPAGAEPRAYHSAEIEFVFRALDSKKLPWREQDRTLSELMASYWTNFAKKGDPNGAGLPRWPVYSSSDGYQVMHLEANPHAAPDALRPRYEFLDKLRQQRAAETE